VEIEMTEVEIVRNDKNFILDFTIYDLDNEPVDLANVSSIIFKFESYEDGTVTSISGEVIDEAGGEAQFFVEDEFVDISLGNYKAEIQITYVSGKVLTAPNIILKVIRDL